MRITKNQKIYIRNKSPVQVGQAGVRLKRGGVEVMEGERRVGLLHLRVKQAHTPPLKSLTTPCTFHHHANTLTQASEPETKNKDRNTEKK